MIRSIIKENKRLNDENKKLRNRIKILDKEILTNKETLTNEIELSLKKINKVNSIMTKIQKERMV